MVSERTPSSIPTKDYSVQLAAVRELLGLEEEDTRRTYLAMFGKAYRTRLLDAIGPTRVTRPEFRAPLNELMGRLVTRLGRSFIWRQRRREWFRWWSGLYWSWRELC